MSFATVAQDLPSLESDLVRLIYTSKLRCENGRAEMTITEILQRSVRNNPTRKISGMLYFNSFTLEILQVLEGPKNSVEELYQVIAADGRHSEVNLLVEEGIETRKYMEWGMLRGTDVDFREMKSSLPTTKEWSDLPGFDLNIVEHLPIAGDLDMKLLRITYHSILRESSFDEQNRIMDDILIRAQKKNKELLVGGMLYYNTESRDILQCIEGPENAIDDLFKAIENDPRHQNVSVLAFYMVT